MRRKAQRLVLSSVMKAADVFCYHVDVQAGIVLVLADEEVNILLLLKLLLPSSDEVLQLLFVIEPRNHR